MSTLKRKNILRQREILNQQSAVQLPYAMQQLEVNGGVYDIDLSKLAPAPHGWNFYSPLSTDKMLELIASIEFNGLIHPIVVWQIEGEYFILSGHNRVDAYRRLYAKTGLERYRSIPAVVKQEISEDQAREIVIDSNWISRTLSVSEKTRSIYQKYVLLSGNKQNKEGKNAYEVIADDYGLSSRQVHRYLRLGLLSNEMMTRIDHGLLSLRSGVILSDFSIDIQQQLIRNYGNQLDNPTVACFKKGMDFDQLEQIIQGEKKEVTISFSVPEDRAEMIRGLLQRELNRILSGKA